MPSVEIAFSRRKMSISAAGPAAVCGRWSDNCALASSGQGYVEIKVNSSPYRTTQAICWDRGPPCPQTRR